MNSRPNVEFVLEAFREIFGKTELGNEIHSSARLEVYELKKQNNEMREQLDEIAEYQRRVVSEQCAPDETHCTCVPALRKHIAELESVCKQAIETGKQQAGEWDRFWQAMGVCSEEITVDDAIAEFKAMRDDRDQFRAMNIDAENLLSETRERLDIALGKLGQLYKVPEEVKKMAWEAVLRAPTSSLAELLTKALDDKEGKA